MPVHMKVSDIVVDPQYQMRVSMSDEAIAEYAEAMQDDAVFPPVTVVEIEAVGFVLVEGFHRIAAAKKAGLLNFPVTIVQGDRRTAKEHAYGANPHHGLRRTNADKRNSVVKALSDPDYEGAGATKIASLCQVARSFVYKIEGELKPKVSTKDTFQMPPESAASNAAAPANSEPVRPALATSPVAAAPNPPRPAEAATPGTGTGPAVTDGGDLTDEELADAAHGGTDPVVELEAANERIHELEAELKVLKADDAVAELAKQYRIAEDARRTASEKMDIAAGQAERLAYHGRFQAAIFKLTGVDTHAAALRIIEGWKPK